MTCGIYKLVFSNITKVYIGQSVNIEKRYAEHINDMVRNAVSKKLLNVISNYGVPKLEILEVCTAEELDEYETFYIDFYDAVDNGFNTNREPGAPNVRGLDSPRTKYSKETYVNVFLALAKEELSNREISKLYNVSEDIVHKIAKGYTHIWLQTEYPLEWSVIEKRNSIGRYHSRTIDRVLISPDGTIYTVDGSIRDFCRKHNLNPSHIGSVLCGARKSHKKWRKANV